jgi:hypothetical protein
MILFSTSNQKGAPIDMAKTVMSQPRKWLNKTLPPHPVHTDNPRPFSTWTAVSRSQSCTEGNKPDVGEPVQTGTASLTDSEKQLLSSLGGWKQGRATPQQAARAKLDPGSNAQKNVYGAWRLWFEHPPAGGGTQCQTFSGNAPAVCEHQALTGADSNPAHSFEIHPVFDVDGVSVARSSIVKTPENKSVKETDKAFGDYSGKNKILHVVRSSTALTLTSITLQDNYVQMHVRVTHAKKPTQRQKDGTVDGGYVLADVMSSNDPEHVLKSDARLFYFLSSIPGDALDKAKQGDEFTLLAMPRVNLDAVLTSSEGKSSITMAVPFEFVVVAQLSSEN